MFTGDTALPRGCADELVRRITAQWQQDGRSKAIVRVPPLAGGSTGLVRRLVDAFRRRGARVLDATGTARADRRRFTEV